MIRALAYALIAYVAALASAVGLSLVIALLTLPARSQGMTPGLPLAPSATVSSRIFRAQRGLRRVPVEFRAAQTSRL